MTPAAITTRANKCRLRAKFGGYLPNRRGRITEQRRCPQWTTSACPPGHTRVSRDLGITGPSPVNDGTTSTLHRLVVVPNPQHLLLTLFFETSLHEEKCPL